MGKDQKSLCLNYLKSGSLSIKNSIADGCSIHSRVDKSRTLNSYLGSYEFQKYKKGWVILQTRWMSLFDQLQTPAQYLFVHYSKHNGWPRQLHLPRRVPAMQTNTRRKPNGLRWPLAGPPLPGLFPTVSRPGGPGATLRSPATVPGGASRTPTLNGSHVKH